MRPRSFDFLSPWSHNVLGYRGFTPVGTRGESCLLRGEVDVRVARGALSGLEVER
jgi:hypothetical protein